MAVPWERFYPYVQPHVPGCPEITIEAHLQEAATEFCERSGVWRYDILTDFTAKNVSDYPVDVPRRTVLENIHALYLDGRPLERVSDRQNSLPQDYGTAPPQHYSIYQDNWVRFYPTPDDKYEFHGVGVLKPAMDATGVEDFIFQSHGRVISCGALAKLMGIPNKEWSNWDLSTYYSAKFAKECDDARIRDTRRVNLRVAPRPFGGPPRHRSM